MTSARKTKKQKHLFIGLVVALIVIVIMAVLIFPRNDDSNENPDQRMGPWKDLSKFKYSISEVPYFNYYEVNGAKKLADIQNPQGSVYLLIGIETDINSSELVEIGEYLDDGGHVIIADDGTEANRITDYLQGRMEGMVNFTGKRYLVDNIASDPDGDPGYVLNLSFIKGDTFPIKDQRYELLTHSPNGLEFTGPGKPLFWSIKQLTVIDQNDNWQMDLEGDKYTPYGDIAIEYDIGTNGGTVTYISTTGLFTDNVYDLHENEGFVRGYIYSMIPDGGDVLLDKSHQWNRYSPHTAILPE